jgi:hypothetical protein
MLISGELPRYMVGVRLSLALSFMLVETL